MGETLEEALVDKLSTVADRGSKLCLALNCKGVDAFIMCRGAACSEVMSWVIDGFEWLGR